ncbi:MAG: hypothetical protein U0V75_19160 [Ferruginibacter sp.]
MPEIVSSELLLPFEKFYGILKENGFPVTPLQVVHANKIIAQYASHVKNELQLCKYLTPVFSGNEDEQELFKKLFGRHFATIHPAAHPQSVPRPTMQQKLKQHWRKLIFIYAAIALTALIVIFSTVKLPQPAYDPDQLTVFITDNNNGGAIVSKWAAFRLLSNEQLKTGIITEQGGTQLPLQTFVTYDWGDSTEKSSLPQHIYINPGEYRLKAMVYVLHNTDTIKQVFISRRVFVCPGYAGINIALSKKASGIYTNDTFTCTAVFKGSDKEKPGAVQWIVDSVSKGSGNSIQLQFDKTGSHTISCIVKAAKQFDYCGNQKDISVFVTDRPSVVKTDSNMVVDMGKAAAAPVSSTDMSYLSRLYKILFAVFAVLGLLFAGLWLKELKLAGGIKLAAMQHYNSIAHALGGSKKKEWLPFLNKNFLPATEHDTVEIARQLRRRVKDHISYLHIPKTISRTIELGGFFMPVKEERTRPSEYLLLIEECAGNSMQVKLFEYVAFLFKKHGLLADIYYYRSNTGRYHNFYESYGTSLEKLYSKHPNHIVLFLGTGHHLTGNNSESLQPKETAALNQWLYKAVVTPVAYPDWTATEKKILLPVIPVVPADMQGLLLLADIITEKESSINTRARLNACMGVFYSCRNFNFQDKQYLLLYCRKTGLADTGTSNEEVNILYEWISALAVYPVLRWEIILALGNALFDHYGNEKLLNYSALLWLVRIPWVQEGKMPGSLRLELLNGISKETERVARETLLQLLKEIPKTATPAGSNAYVEREIQQAINQFSLYASDPVYYHSYHPSKYVFKKLWENKQLNDEVLEERLKGPVYKPGRIKNKTAAAQNYRTATEAFLRSSEREETLLGKVYLAMALMSAVVAVGSLFALRVLFVWNNYL